MNIDAVKFSEDVRAVAISLIGHARESVDLPMEAERGVRFNHTEGVLWRLESMFSEDEFIHDPLMAVTGALIDAARSDWWYSHEKAYDDDIHDAPEDEYEWEGDAC